MALSPKTTGIVFSLVLSAMLIGAAYYLSGPLTPPVADAGSTEELLKAYAEKDSDGDKLADWQESLYGSDPNNPKSIDESMTDREAVEAGKVKPKFTSDTEELDALAGEGIPGVEVTPTSLTDRFARQFFENYLLGKSAGAIPTSEDLAVFVQQAVDELLENNTTKNAFTQGSIVTVPDSDAAFRAYAVAAESAFAAHTIPTEKSEILYFQDAVYGNDKDALSTVGQIGDAYQKIAAAYAKVPVPASVKNAHLKTANIMLRLGHTIEDMSMYNQDPLRAFVGLSAYEEIAREMIGGFAEIEALFAREGVVIVQGEQGYSFFAALQGAAEAHSKK